ncbi:unnamed protein product [Didymodactylos carnosus]|uniref:Uncharacterized protein n=1 Tax=Didymodactylos carnosus TaxID=1234261 RepID=A0A814GNI2_9BILA|nr:unnamed protein product [Didymodactylos carnosus]CAF0998630.1 unnamed protein product [Didymodactylos carnosus]CAF3617358.1 unnamed protein product [Didymodactylos carnosus]CAF3770114.1 unnamed protein product [Didymodactylos carnosus]
MSLQSPSTNALQLPFFCSSTSLLFYLDDSTSSSQILTIYNPYEFPVKYKVLCTAPRKYLIAEPQGEIRGQHSVDSVVRLLDISSSSSNQNIVHKIRIKFYDRRKPQDLIGKRDITCTILPYKPLEESFDDDNVINSSGRLRSSLSSSPTQSLASTNSTNVLTQDIRDPIVVFFMTLIGLLSAFILVLPGLPEENTNTRVPHYLHMSVNSKTGMIYVFNIIVGTGALALPKAFHEGGYILSTILLLILGFFSYVSATFMIESMALANGLFGARRATAKRLNSIPGSDGENISDRTALLSAENDDEVQHSEIDEEHQAIVQRFEINEKIEMGQMAQMFLNRTGIAIFYICICLYLYGDLAIYGSAVPKSIRDVICTYVPTNCTNITHSDRCWEKSSLSRVDVYRIFATIFFLTLGLFVFGNAQKTKLLQIITTLFRWTVFTLSSSFPIIGITLRNNLQTIVQSCYPTTIMRRKQRIAIVLLTLLPPLTISLITDDIKFLVGITGSYAGVAVQYVIPALLVYNARRITVLKVRKIQFKNQSPFQSQYWIFAVFIWSWLSTIVITMYNILPKKAFS